jgi:HK97 family phage major capsid protein
MVSKVRFSFGGAMSQSVADLAKATAGLTKTVEGKVKSFENDLTEVKKTVKRIAENPVRNAQGTLAAEAKSGEEARFGFKSFSHLAKEVYNAGITRRPSDLLNKAYQSEMVQKAATGMGELVGADGGFLIPPEFINKIMERMYEKNSLLEQTDKYTTNGNALTFPRNAESSRANGSRWGGVRAYWVGEGSSITRSAPTFGKLTMNLHKMACLGVATEELLQDSGTALEQYLFRVFSDEMSFVAGDAIVNGTGAGMPLGIMNAACTISVSAEAGQAADTINTANIVKMWARMWGGSRKNAVWLINQDVEPQLYTMTLGVGTGGVVTYMPPGGLSGAPYATLLGRPVMTTEFNPTLGDAGDIILADLGAMCSLTKGGGMQNATSVHFYFDTDQQAFRVTYRLDAQPWWATALTPFKGTATQSPFVTLAAR